MDSNSKHGNPGQGAAREMHGNHGERRTSAHAHSGHNQHAAHSVAMFRDKFWLSLVLTLPVVFWSDEVQHWFGYHAPAFPGSRLIPAILGTIVLVYGGSVFIQGCVARAFRPPARHDDLDQPLSLSLYCFPCCDCWGFEVDVWWELATLITVMVLGHWLEMKAGAQAHGALDALAALLPDSAERITESGVEKVPLAELRVGDVVLVRPDLACLLMGPWWRARPMLMSP